MHEKIPNGGEGGADHGNSKLDDGPDDYIDVVPCNKLAFRLGGWNRATYKLGPVNSQRIAGT